MGRMEEMRVDGPGDGKTLLVPSMEPMCARLAAAVFRSMGYNAFMTEENDATLAIGLKYTAGGECVPCPTTLGSLIHAVRSRNLDPDKVVFFMPTASGPCRFGQYTKLERLVLEKLGWKGLQIMSPSAENAYAGIDMAARKRLWHALVVGDVLRKMMLHARPYEKRKGEVDELVETWMKKLEDAFSVPDVKPIAGLVAEAAKAFAAVPKRDEKRPLVGVVGEIYVRTNPFLNQEVCRRIEDLGGEAWLAPISEWLLYTSVLSGRIAREKGGLRGFIDGTLSWLQFTKFFLPVERKYYEAAGDFLAERHEPPIQEVLAAGLDYMPWQFEGEAILTLGRAKLFAQRDGARAVVNCSPMFCMPGTVTTSVFPRLEKELGIPAVCLFYDGSGDPNQALVPVMHYLREHARQDTPAAVLAAGD